MRLNYFIFLWASLVATSVFSEGCASRQAARNEGVPSSFSEGAQGLQQIYETPIPAQIRETFDRTTRHICSKDHEQCSGCAFTVFDGGKRVDIFSKKFIVVDLNPGSFGGVEATIIFEDAPNAFWLWLYDIGPNEYQLRSIKRLPKPLDEGFVRQLQNSAYRRYWLQAP
jgi:hypothetical protein